MSPRRFAHEPPSPCATASLSNHFGVGSGLVDEDKLAGIKARLLGLPRLPRFSDVGPFLLDRVQRFFLKLIPCRLKNRRIEVSVVTNPRPSDIRCSSSIKVRSDSIATSFKSHSAWGSSGERLLPPRRLGLMLPVSFCSPTQRIADDTPTR
jgi:hypothetical protein